MEVKQMKQKQNKECCQPKVEGEQDYLFRKRTEHLDREQLYQYMRCKQKKIVITAMVLLLAIALLFSIADVVTDYGLNKQLKQRSQGATELCDALCYSHNAGECVEYQVYQSEHGHKLVKAECEKETLKIRS